MTDTRSDKGFQAAVNSICPDFGSHMQSQTERSYEGLWRLTDSDFMRSKAQDFDRTQGMCDINRKQYKIIRDIYVLREAIAAKIGKESKDFWRTDSLEIYLKKKYHALQDGDGALSEEKELEFIGFRTEIITVFLTGERLLKDASILDPDHSFPSYKATEELNALAEKHKSALGGLCELLDIDSEKALQQESKQKQPLRKKNWTPEGKEKNRIDCKNRRERKKEEQHHLVTNVQALEIAHEELRTAIKSLERDRASLEAEFNGENATKRAKYQASSTLSLALSPFSFSPYPVMPTPPAQALDSSSSWPATPASIGLSPSFMSGF